MIKKISSLIAFVFSFTPLLAFSQLPATIGRADNSEWAQGLIDATEDKHLRPVVQIGTLRNQGNSVKFIHHCTGVVVSESKILTSAYCFESGSDGKPIFENMVVIKAKKNNANHNNKYYVSTEDLRMDLVYREVTSVVVNPTYNMSKLNAFGKNNPGNLAIITMHKPMLWIKPIRIANKATIDMMEVGDRPVRMAGFTLLQIKSQSWYFRASRFFDKRLFSFDNYRTLSPDQCQEITKKYVDQDAVPGFSFETSFDKSEYGGVAQSQICTISPTIRSCTGEAGSPLLLMDDRGRYELIGIASWGMGSFVDNVKRPFESAPVTCSYPRDPESQYIGSRLGYPYLGPRVFNKETPAQSLVPAITVFEKPTAFADWIQANAGIDYSIDYPK